VELALAAAEFGPVFCRLVGGATLLPAPAAEEEEEDEAAEEEAAGVSPNLGTGGSALGGGGSMLAVPLAFLPTLKNEPVDEKYLNTTQTTTQHHTQAEAQAEGWVEVVHRLDVCLSYFGVGCVGVDELNALHRCEHNGRGSAGH
jgi:hypothetical protein